MKHPSVRKIRPDFLVENHGSIFLVKPLTPLATSWLEEHVGHENGVQPYWPTCVVEHRYVGAILEGIRGDGLVLS